MPWGEGRRRRGARLSSPSSEGLQLPPFKLPSFVLYCSSFLSCFGVFFPCFCFFLCFSPFFPGTASPELALDRPSPRPPKISLFSPLPPQISFFLLSLEVCFVELWPRFKAMAHPKCAFGLLWVIFMKLSRLEGALGLSHTWLPGVILCNPSDLWGRCCSHIMTQEKPSGRWP